MMKKFIFDLTLSDWEEWVRKHSYPAFRAEQMYQWCAKGVQKTEEMSNIPKNIREDLENSFITNGLHMESELISQKDGTRKYVFSLHDGNIIETVLMKYSTGYSVCITSQAGCRMGCTFCASAAAGFGRNLTAGELLGQITVVSAHLGEHISRVVVMGIGEPFDNFEQLDLFLKLANDAKGLNLGARHITVSTCGLVPQMIKFMSMHRQVNLAVSLHAADNTLREKLMPIAKKYNITALMNACRDYTKQTGRRITFEYSMFCGLNDAEQQALELVRTVKGIHCHVNLIAANEFPGGSFKRSKPEQVQAFQKILERARIPVTLRREMGSDILAACGQLRRGMLRSEEK